MTIRLYDGAASDAAVRRDALDTAAAILADSGVRARWLDCTLDQGVRRCDPERSSDLMIRIVPSIVAEDAPSGATIGPATAGFARRVLGFAVVPESGGGVLATIFMEGVREAASRAGVPLSVLLGRAIAHEIGHLLLGSSGHGDRGLMREIWTDAELAANHPGDWRFTPSEQSRLQASRLVHASIPLSR